MKTLAQIAYEAFLASWDTTSEPPWKDVEDFTKHAWGNAAAAVSARLTTVQQDDRPLEPGDVVQLKSGGPAMTITREDTPGRSVACWWFDGYTARCESFPLVCLRLVEPPVAPAAAGAEPDAWDWATVEEGEPVSLPPDGHTWTGPWEPRNAVWTGEATLVLLRRPLRRVSP